MTILLHDSDVQKISILGMLLVTMTFPAMLEEFLEEFHSVSGTERDALTEKYGVKFLRD